MLHCLRLEPLARKEFSFLGVCWCSWICWWAPVCPPLCKWVLPQAWDVLSSKSKRHVQEMGSAAATQTGSAEGTACAHSEWSPRLIARWQKTFARVWDLTTWSALWVGLLRLWTWVLSPPGMVWEEGEATPLDQEVLPLWAPFLGPQNWILSTSEAYFLSS